jgi:hypothetical protein
METLRRIASYLVEHERIDGNTFDALFDGSQAVTNDGAEWRPESSRPRAWDEIAEFLGRRQRPSTPLVMIPELPALPPPPLLEIPAHLPVRVPVPEPVAAAVLDEPAARPDPRRPRQRTLLGSLANRRLRPIPAPMSALFRRAGAWLTDGPEAEAER